MTSVPPPQILVIFKGGPCDGLEQRTTCRPPTPEYLFPWRRTVAVYRVDRIAPYEYVYVFDSYRPLEEP